MNWEKKEFTKIKQLKAIIVNMDLNGTKQAKKHSIGYGFLLLLLFCIVTKLIRREKWENMQSSRSRGCLAWKAVSLAAPC